MPAIDVPFTINARVQLTALERAALEIERHLERQSFAPGRNLRHHHGLRDISFSQVAPVNGGRLASHDANGLRSNLQDIVVIRVCLCVEARRNKQEHARDYDRPRRHRATARRMRPRRAGLEVTPKFQRDSAKVIWLADEWFAI